MNGESAFLWQEMMDKAFHGASSNGHDEHPRLHHVNIHNP
jgi:hypothetical protein